MGDFVVIELWILCLVMAQVSDTHYINVNKLRWLRQKDEYCEVAQYYNPSFIKSEWSCKEVEESIIEAMRRGCDRC